MRWTIPCGVSSSSLVPVPHGDPYISWWLPDPFMMDLNSQAKAGKAPPLSHIAEAVVGVLSKRHAIDKNSLWNVSSGAVVGELHQTPRGAFLPGVDQTLAHDGSHDDDWFPGAIAEIMKRTKSWCDVLSLTSPDGRFMVAFQDALAYLSEKATADQPISVRMIFADVLSPFHLNTQAIVRELTMRIAPHKTSHLRLWVGAWRSQFSWNHAKLIAVDGIYLHTGGHNLWDDHYLKKKPVFDLSVELKGRVAVDGHIYANEQWCFVADQHNCTFEQAHHCTPFIPKTTSHVACFPAYLHRFPPQYPNESSSQVVPEVHDIPMISIGTRRETIFKRYSTDAKPANDAMIAMIMAATRNIKMAVQDIGPYPYLLCSYVVAPNSDWPHELLDALASAIWERNVELDIIFSNQNAVPGRLSKMSAAYGHGWTCEDTAARIMKAIRRSFPDATDDALRETTERNLRFCYLRTNHGNRWKDGNTKALHSKHYIIDDVTTYIGSQNLYVSGGAEFGVLIDDAVFTKSAMAQYWNPMFAASYKASDCNTEEVMQVLHALDRPCPRTLSSGTWHMLSYTCNWVWFRPHHARTLRLRRELARIASFGLTRRPPKQMVLPWRTLCGISCFLAATGNELLVQWKRTLPPLVFSQREKGDKMELIHQLMASRILSCNIKPSLFWGTRNILATLAGLVLKGPSPCCKYKRFRQLLKMSQDGATIALDWELPTSSDGDSSERVEQRERESLHGGIAVPLVLILHGLGNDTSTGYMRSLMRACVDRGWIAVGMNFRCCGKSPITTPRGYNGAYTGDLRCVVQNLSARMANDVPLFLAGHSVGANIMTKYLGEEGLGGTLPAPVAGGISLANPTSHDARQWKFPLTQALSLSARKTLAQNLAHFLPSMKEEHIRHALTRSLMSNTLEQFDSSMTPISIRNDPYSPFSVMMGYSSAEQYWEDASSFKQIRHVPVPLLQISSQDDFLIYKEAHEKLGYSLSNPNIIVVETRCGGHLGWYESATRNSHSKGAPSRWSDRAALSFIDAILLARQGGKGKRMMASPQLAKL